MKTRNNIKISIVDESSIYRQVLKELLIDEGFNSISEAGEEEAMLKQLAIDKPDILIYDFLNSSERFYITMEKIKKVVPEIRLMVLSFEDNSKFINFCFDNGVAGFCNKLIQDFKVFATSLEKMANGEKIILVKEVA